MLFKSESTYKLESSSKLKFTFPLQARLMEIIEINGEKFFPSFKLEEVFRIVNSKNKYDYFYVNHWIKF